LPDTGGAAPNQSIPWWSVPAVILALALTIYIIRQERKLTSDR
jgi:hypothetical protein